MFTTPAQTLSRALALVLAGIDHEKVAAYVLIESRGEAAWMVGTGQNVAIEIQLPVTELGDEFEWCVCGSDLLRLSRLSTGDMALEATTNRLTVHTNSGKHSLSARPAGLFPAIRCASKAAGSITGQLLATLLTLALIGAEANPYGPDWQKNVELSGKDGKLTVTGCSSARVSSVTALFTGSLHAVIARQSAVILAEFCAKAEGLTIACSENVLTLRTDTAAIHVQLSSLSLADWRVLLRDAYGFRVEMDTANLQAALKRSLLAASDGTVNVTFQGNEAVLTAQNSEGRQGNETLPTVSNLNGTPYPLRILGSQVLDHLRHAKGPVIWQGNREQNVLLFTLKEPQDYEWVYIQTTLTM
jgi:DNA polymerase III sliding clamp (beta) subunit (PCNA family)